MTLPKIMVDAAPLGGRNSYYLGGHELAVLVQTIEAVTPRVMVEFGCNDGATARRILDHVPSIEQYIGIDVERSHKTSLVQQRAEVPLVAGYYVLDDERFFLLKQDSRTIDALDPCDAVFIDGDHSFGAVVSDSDVAGKALRPGGVIVWHDYGNPAVEVTAALDWLHATGWPIVHIEGTWLAMLRT